MRSLKPRAPCQHCGISAPITHKRPPHLCASCRRAFKTTIPLVDEWLISDTNESLNAFASAKAS
jgi:hypothetical protein